MCGVPPFHYKFFCAVSPPCNSVPLPHLTLSWILSKVKNLASSSLQDEAIDWLFFTELLGPSLIINLAQLVSPSVALPAELVVVIIFVVIVFADCPPRSVFLDLSIFLDIFSCDE